MMKTGSVDSKGEWTTTADPPGWQSGEASLAESIEKEMEIMGIIDLGEDSEETRLQRREAIVALSRGIVKYLRAAMDLQFDQSDLATNIPASQITLQHKVD